MSRATNKHDLLQAARENYAKLNRLITGLSEVALHTPFDFSRDVKKKEAHWRRDKNLRDILVHLYEWHQLLLQWVTANQHGVAKPFLPEPYNWKTYGEMNVALWEKHQHTSLADATALLQASHQAVLTLAETFTDEALFSQGIYPWTGGSTLGAYFVSTTASHYDWAIKKLKAHQKNIH